MDNFIAARSQMGLSLAFHIIFATIGISLPLMMTISEWRWRSTGDPAYLLLAKRWAKGTTTLFAVANHHNQKRRCSNPKPIYLTTLPCFSSSDRPDHGAE
jgi:hypothetical protein